MRSLKLFVHSGLPADRLSAWLGPIEALLPTDDEFGAVMIDAATIDRSATIARYRALHARLPRAIGALADTIRDRRCGVVLSNMSYIATAAAAAAGVPSVAFCSLAWHEIAAACFADPPELPREMLACYLQATCVLRLQPGTPFAGLPSTAVARPIARVGRARRDELAAWLHIDPARPIALLSFSVLPARVPPLLAAPHDFALVGPAEWRDYGVAVIEDAPLPYPDLLASVDVVVSKAGYGTAAEVCCASIPAVLLDRPDWPEQRYVVDWLHAHGRCLMVPSIQAASDATPGALRSAVAASAIAAVSFSSPSA